MPTSQCSLPIEIAEQDRTANGLQIQVRRLWVKVVFPDRHGNLLFSNCLLDTGAALCVVPWSHHQTNDLDWQPLPGSWPPSFLTGKECHVLLVGPRCGCQWTRRRLCKVREQ
jgi:hypothetical protein